MRHRLLFGRRSPPTFLNDSPRPPAIPQPHRISTTSTTSTISFTNLTPLSPPPPPPAPAPTDETCPICLEALPAATPRTHLPCGHAACHTACMRAWLRTSPRCPLCLAPVAGPPSVFRASFRDGWRLCERRTAGALPARTSNDSVSLPQGRLAYRRRLARAKLRPRRPTSRCFSAPITADWGCL